MRLQRMCKICGKAFSAIKVTQFFCCRKCFKRDYYLRTKTNAQEEKQRPHYPTKKCAYCEERSTLDFDPMKNVKMFDAWACPHCGTTNKLLWEHQNNPNSYQIITQMLLTFSLSSLKKTELPKYKYEIYKLPIPRLEHGNKHIVVMSCETLNMADIQKGNRKKIIFS